MAFEIIKQQNELYSFVLKAGNGEEVLISFDEYATIASVDNGIASVKLNCNNSDRFDFRSGGTLKIDEDECGIRKYEKPCFAYLRAGNNQIIGITPTHKNGISLENCIASIRFNADKG
jgi:uncharacterized protein YegP (UPF0339 family)